MATSNKDRQAAFKNRMRERGLAQRPFWVSPEQEAEIKAFLNVDHAHLSQAQAQLDARAARLDEREKALAERERQLSTRDKNPATQQRAAKAPDKPVLSSPSLEHVGAWTEKLVRAMTMHTPWGSTERVEVDTSYTIEQRRDIAARLNTSTKATATKVGQLTKELSESGYDLLSPAEVSALGEVCGFLRGLGEATSEAYTRTKTLSKKLSAVEAKRWKIVSEAMRETGLATMTDMESVQWRLHMLGPKRSVHDRDYDLQKLRDNRLDSFDAWSLRYDVKSVREIVHEDLGSDLFARLKADPALESSAAVILRERIHGFEEARAQLVEQHRPFIEHVQALLTAEALERAEKANNHGKT